MCKEECATWAESRAEGVSFNRKHCGKVCPIAFKANRVAINVFQSTFWQYKSSGMGDATFPGEYAQTMLSDLGITGSARVDQLERIGILDEQRRSGDAIRMKRKKKDSE
jgi:hypothetical protein